MVDEMVAAWATQDHGGQPLGDTDAARAALLSHLASLRAEAKRAQTRHGNDVLIAERDAARSALAECQRGLALSEARERKARAEVDAAKGGDLIVGETLAALLWYSASPSAGRAPMWLNTAITWFRDQSASARATWIADAQRMYGQAADRVASSDAKATAAEASLSRATERGERMREAIRTLYVAWGAAQTADALAVMADAVRAWDARDAAGGEDGR